ncbi:MAG TPA: dTMP kinase [Bryobacteraceae bacterium]|nr:dTMP kinase [Bryobacteraceae bacterium]
MTRRSGVFITFEGPDGSGKSTQMQILAERIRSTGREVIETQEPGGTQIGRQIRAILLDADNKNLCPVAEMLLYFAARAQNVDERILPAWENGSVVLSDRFTDSTLAYQGGGRQLGRDVVMQLHEISCHGIQPDLTVCIDIDTETGLERTRQRNGPTRDRLDEEAVEFHRRVRSLYLELAKEHPERIRIIDGNGNVEEVTERIWKVVNPLV